MPKLFFAICILLKLFFGVVFCPNFEKSKKFVFCPKWACNLPKLFLYFAQTFFVFCPNFIVENLYFVQTSEPKIRAKYNTLTKFSRLLFRKVINEITKNKQLECALLLRVFPYLEYPLYAYWPLYQILAISFDSDRLESKFGYSPLIWLRIR